MMSTSASDANYFDDLLRHHMSAGTRSPENKRLNELSPNSIIPWSDTELADEINVSARTIRNYLGGRTLPTEKNFKVLARAFFGKNLGNDAYSQFLNAWLSAITQRPLPVLRSEQVISLGKIPSQGAGPHFELNTDGLITQLRPSELDADKNNVGRIRQLLPLVRQAISDISVRLKSSNAFSELARDVIQYGDEISLPESDVSWGLIWGLGVRLEEAIVASERKILGRFEPEFEDGVQAALQSWRSLHHPMIMATAEGVDLQSQADLLRMTREEQQILRSAALDLSDDLRKSQNIIETPAVEIIENAARAISDGHHPERGAIFGIATIKNASVVLLSAAAVAVPGHFLGGVLGTDYSMAAWEAVKKSASFNSAVVSLGRDFDRLRESGASLLQGQLSRLLPFQSFVREHEVHLHRIAKVTNQLHWIGPWIDQIVQKQDLSEDQS